MFEANYRIYSPAFEVTMEFETFKGAWKRLMWLRNSEGARNWPYRIENIKTGKIFDGITERQNKDEFRRAMFHARGTRILNQLGELDATKQFSFAGLQIYSFGFNMMNTGN